MSTKDCKKSNLDPLIDMAERINWSKSNDDYTNALDKLNKSALETGKNIRDGIKKALEIQFKNAENVNHPSHYCDGKIEVIDFIEDKKLNYHLGNVVKYISRAGKKCPEKEVEDLKKARWYLDRYIEKLEEADEERIRNH